MEIVVEQDVYKAPESDLNIPQEGQGILASRWARLGGSLIDTIVTICITLPLMFLAGGFDAFTAGVDGQPPAQPSLLYSFAIGIVGFAVFLLINATFLLSDGQTIGKKLVSTRIVTDNNQKASGTTLLKRYGLYWVVALIPVIAGLLSFVNMLFIFGKAKRCLHDYVGGTKVVKA